MKAADSRYHPVYAYAAARNIPILSHSLGGCGFSGPGLFVGIVAEFPEVRIILGHSGGTFGGLKETIAAVKEKPDNLYADLTGSTQFLNRVEMLCKEITAEKIVFGSDAPWIEPGTALGAVLFADIPDTDKQLILSGNIRRIIGWQ